MKSAGFSLRRATAADAPAPWAIRSDAIRRTCSSHYPGEFLERWTASPLPETFFGRIEDGYVIAAIAGSTIVGFAALKASDACIDTVFVSPDYGRRGLGRQLLAHLEEVAAGMGLPKLGLKASLNAAPFYRAAGFTEISEGVHISSVGVEIACVNMQRQLDPPGKSTRPVASPRTGR